jgi:hypothetical protein
MEIMRDEKCPAGRETVIKLSLEVRKNEESYVKAMES